MLVNNKRLVSLVGLLALSTGLVDCAKKADAVAVTELEGTWKAPCVAGTDAQNPSGRDVWTFSGNTYTHSHQIFLYTDTTCAGAQIFSLDNGGTFTIGAAATVVDTQSAGAKKVNLTAVSADATALTADGTSIANGLLAGNNSGTPKCLPEITSTWTTGEKKSLLGEVCGNMVSASDTTAGKINYNIFLITGTTLNLGANESAATDGSTEAKIPTRISNGGNSDYKK